MAKTDVEESLSWASSFSRSCAAKFPEYVDHDDLTSAGVVAYLHAASRYKSRLGASFRGYCATRIRGAVLDEMRRWTWAPRSVLQNRRRIREAQSALSMRLQRAPTRAELASEMGLNAGDLDALETQSQYRQVISIDDAGTWDHSDEHVSLAERIPDGHVASPCARVLGEDDRRQMIAAIRLLPKSHATVIVLHYLKNIPLREIASTLSVTPSRVSQLHHQAIERMQRLCQAPRERAKCNAN